MSKPEQLLLIEPESELKFQGPFNVSVLTFMRLTNPTDKKILFKIKTTAPKKYCVRPNSGILEPKNTIEVAIALQPFVFDANEKNKHKFMVQSLVAPEGEFDAERLWKELPPEQMMDSKLKCVFELPVDANTVIDLSSQKMKNADGTAKEETVIKQEATLINEDKPRQAELANYDNSKTAEELKKLRDDNIQLRKENLELNEQLLKLRIHNAEVLSSRSAALQSAGGAAAFSNPYAPPALANEPNPVIFIAVGVIIAIVGLLIGKFAL